MISILYPQYHLKGIYFLSLSFLLTKTNVVLPSKKRKLISAQIFHVFPAATVTYNES